MSITIGPWTFDHVSYDADADVAYLHIGEPRVAVGVETPEGHIARFDAETNEFCGLTLVAMNEIVERDGFGRITVPAPPASVDVPRADLDALMCA